MVGPLWSWREWSLDSSARSAHNPTPASPTVGMSARSQWLSLALTLSPSRAPPTGLSPWVMASVGIFETMATRMSAGTKRGKAASRPVARRRGIETPYDVLQVSPFVDDVVLRAAYHALARANHPDVSQDPDAAERMRAINEAWETLSDPKLRAMYDLTLNGERSRSVSTDGHSIQRITVCWRCADPLAGAFARYCSNCHWLLCEACHACGCQNKGWQTKLRPQCDQALWLMASGWAVALLVSLAWLGVSWGPAVRAAVLP